MHIAHGTQDDAWYSSDKHWVISASNLLLITNCIRAVDGGYEVHAHRLSVFHKLLLPSAQDKQTVQLVSC